MQNTIDIINGDQDDHKDPDKNPEIDPGENPDDTERTPDDAVKEPLTPVPAIDDINPPLKVTLGGGDLVIPLDKK